MARIARPYAQADADNRRGKSSVLGKNKDPWNGRALLDSPDDIADILAASVEVSLAGRILDHAESPTGTALYTAMSPEDLRVEGIGQRTEHTEYPMVRFSPGDLKEARTTDIGGKFRVSDEAIDSGDVSLLTDGMTLLGISIRDTLEKMMFETLNLLTEVDGPGPRLLSTAGWQGVRLSGANPTPEGVTPWADIVRAKRLLRQHGLNAQATHLIVDEESADALSITYGPSNIAEDWGIELLTSPKLEPGTGYLLDNRSFGKLVTKAGMQSETWREPGIRSTWVQSFIEPTIVIHRPTNVVKLQGLDGNVNTEI